MDSLKFPDLIQSRPILAALKKMEYHQPTPIQKKTIPLALDRKDILGIAQTGTGKTAAFCLPMIALIDQRNSQREAKCPNSLILTPTRELAIQIKENLDNYGSNLNQRYSVIFGGVGQNPQVRGLQRGVDVLVATPGRLLDLIQQRHLNLKNVEIFVLDEADRMLDMGFMKDIQKILPLLPKRRHNLFFSATMPSSIQKLANEILHHPVKVEVTPPATTVKRIQQSVMYVKKQDKIKLLIDLIKIKNLKKTLVFVEMKHVANKVTEKLQKSGITAAVIHGNKSQNARQRAIKEFSHEEVQVLVATDIASRGIDIDGISHVINYELSNIAESYVHRIGRTARAGADGSAISLVTADEKAYLINIEKTTKQTIAIDRDHEHHCAEAENAKGGSVGKAKAKLEAERKANFRRKPKNSSDRRVKTKRDAHKKTHGADEKSSSPKPNSRRKKRARISQKEW